jgi:hypothetical protein
MRNSLTTLKMTLISSAIIVLLPTICPAQTPGPDADHGMGSPLMWDDEVGPFSGGYNSHIAVADFDNDGDIDIVMHASLGGGANNNFWGVYLYENITPNSKQSVLLFDAPSKLFDIDKAPIAYDCNQDGLIDLVIDGQWHRNQGDLKFDGGIVIPNFPQGVQTIIDWNNDSIPDLLTGDKLPGNFWPPASVWQNGESPYTDDGIWKGGTLRKTLRWHTGKIDEKGAISWVDMGVMPVGEHPLETYGGANPTLSDWDDDGDLDLLVGGEYDLTYFENIGDKQNPKLNRGRKVKVESSHTLPGIYIRPAACHLNDDKAPDLFLTQENGNISILYGAEIQSHAAPVYNVITPIIQKKPYLDAGCLAVITAADWDKDGDIDIITGNSYGEVLLFENSGSAKQGIFKNREPLYVNAEAIRINAGANGSIQGPNEAHYGYTCPVIADWNKDGEPDLILSDIWGKYTYYERNKDGELKDGVPIRVAEKKTTGKSRYTATPPWVWHKPKNSELITQWRCQPAVTDWDGDGACDLITLESEGYLALYKGCGAKNAQYVEQPEREFLYKDNQPIRITNGLNGRAGRMRVLVIDWDKDGDRDIIRGCTQAGDHEDPNYAEYERIAVWYENTGDDRHFLKARSLLKNDEGVSFCGHATSPAILDWDNNGSLDLLLGTQEGLIYFFSREYLEGK